MNGKGSARRPTDEKAYAENWERVFKNSVCKKCNGEGWYQYSTRGTPHFTRCDKCCKHTGWFDVVRGQSGFDENKDNRCCLDGCGTMRRDLEC